MHRDIKEWISIPSNVEATLDGSLLKVKGPKGSNERNFANPKIKLTIEDKKIVLLAKNATKKEKTIIGTFKAHIKNMILGAIEGITYQLKICSGHFPMSVTAEDRYILIKNFLGEKTPRKAKLLHGVDAKIEDDVITLTGSNIEAVSQVASNIEQSTKIKNRDLRIFQDGCYIIMKNGKEVK